MEAYLNGSKNHTEQSKNEAREGKVVVPVRGEPNAEDYGDEREVRVGGIVALVAQAVDEHREDGACGPHDLVERDGHHCSVSYSMSALVLTLHINRLI